MVDFTIHTAETAPDDAKQILTDSQKNLGFVPNLWAIMAESPQILKAYQQVGALFEASSLSTVEQNVVWLTINVVNDCHYCVPAHTGIAKHAGVDDAIINAIRDEQPIPDARLEALRQFTISVVLNRGELDDVQVQAFLDAGFTKANILDVILGLSHKVLSNYVNHFADTPVDEAFAQFAWEVPDRSSAAA